MKLNQYLLLWIAAVVLAGCATGASRAPIYERGKVDRKSDIASEPMQKKSARENDWRPEIHVVQKGDTLYSLAFNYGFDYHELAELNGIQDPSVISIGQQIRLFPGRITSIAPTVSVEVKPIESLLKEQPKLVKYPYSEAALAQIDKVQEEVSPPITANTEAKSKPESAKPQPAVEAPADEGDEAALDWIMPTKGKVIAQFSESANRKGIDIAGKLGQPVLAGASGKVVYSGSGLRGYGKLIIIKHNKTYLSAYAHNDKVLIKEGQSVERGQKIAEMGSTDTERVKLHFEVRRLGKPVDPAKYLPLGKS